MAVPPDDFLRMHGAEIAARWEQQARASLALRNGAGPVLGGLVPVLLDCIAGRLGAVKLTTPPLPDGAVSGPIQVPDDVPLAQLLEEHRLLRRTVMSAIRECAASTGVGAEQADAVLDAVDELLGGWIRRFVEAREQRRADAIERLHLALASAEIGTWDADTSTGDLLVDARWAAIFGVEGPGVVRFGEWQELIHPDDRHHVRERVRASLTGPEKGSYRAEYRVVRRSDRTVRWLSGRGSVFFGPDGKANRFLGIVTDVTELKEAEAARERFLGVLGHDLRHPLSAIAFSAEQLARLGPDLRKAQAAVARIARSSLRMNRMIADLLDLARGRSGALPLTLAPGDLRATCAAVVDEMRVLHPDRRIELVADGDLTGTWDGDRITQAVINLVANAVTHGADPVCVTATSTADRMTVAITNAGPPIRPEERSSLFDPFQRGEGARGRGAGLGLYIVSQIMRAHAGSVLVTSDDASTAFTMEWPRHAGVRPSRG